MKRKIAIFLVLSVLVLPTTSMFAFTSSAAEYTAEIDCTSAILMEAATGEILYEKNADEALPPASVTKVMTLLIVMESIDAGRIGLEDKVTTSERAAAMGGSQVYLKVGEEMSVEELLKCVIICSANDACVALAEYIAGSEEAFVGMMNERAVALGMENTHFENTNGLDDTVTNHVTSARDIAIMSRELLRHAKILEYSGIWMDSIRNGEFVLTNTNRLIRFYSGANGLKTGSTSKAGFCISATAKRNGMQLICVIMGAPTRDVRNDIARTLLDFGFASYGLFQYDGGEVGEIKVTGGNADTVSGVAAPFCALLDKGKAEKVESKILLADSVAAPIAEGDSIGEVIFTLDGKEVGRTGVTAEKAVEKIDFFTYFWKLLHRFVTFCDKDLGAFSVNE